MRPNLGVAYFRATLQEYFNKLSDAVDPSHTNLTSLAFLRNHCC
jgi:hypothetical protein